MRINEFAIPPIDIHPPEPWGWPHCWFERFIKLRETSKTYVKVDEFFTAKKRWPIDRIFNRYLFWHTIKRDTITTELLDWLCKDNTKSKWTLSLYWRRDSLELYAMRTNGTNGRADPEYQMIYTFYFKDKKDLLLFKMRW